MKFGIVIPNCHGDFADIRLVAEVAHEAEEAGWDGFFVWDHIGDKWGDEVSDPWVMLAAIAMRTQRIKIGTMVTPITRRRPWKLAREAVTLDHLSGGRMILGVGSGGGVEYVQYHEPGEARELGEMLDEALLLLEQLWSGECISYTGHYYQIENVRHLPRPLQEPQIPIWLGGRWPHKRPMRRAARWDGVIPIGKGLSLTQQMSPTQMQECIDYILALQRQEQRSLPYEVAHFGLLEGKDRGGDAALVAAYAAIGITWWMESITWERGCLRDLTAFIRQGPPH
ncbi:MAG TPA: LLM class flavin-dependent oxidoreductase [Ktedonobacteraceae bacterium]|nr:LLM class flavin-dependent oxidoreductase [Ktedonobacteraceae bacterium]